MSIVYASPYTWIITCPKCNISQIIEDYEIRNDKPIVCKCGNDLWVERPM